MVATARAHARSAKLLIAALVVAVPVLALASAAPQIENFRNQINQAGGGG